MSSPCLWLNGPPQHPYSKRSNVSERFGTHVRLDEISYCELVIVCYCEVCGYDQLLCDSPGVGVDPSCANKEAGCPVVCAEIDPWLNSQFGEVSISRCDFQHALPSRVKLVIARHVLPIISGCEKPRITSAIHQQAAKVAQL